MEIRKVASSNIDSIGYDNVRKILKVVFKNGFIYDYYDISAETHEELITAQSVGKYFNSYIRNTYKYTKVGNI